MAEHAQRHGSASTATSGSAHAPQQHALSCTHCRQRKIKCDKIHPCSPCSRSNLHCVFPERVRHPKKKKNGAKAANEELLQRLSRMEDLIEKMKVEGKDINGARTSETRDSASPRIPYLNREASEGSRSQDGGSPSGDGTTRFMGSAFFRSLTNEVEGLKQTMDDVSDEEYSPDSGHTPSDTHTSNTSVLFGSSPLPAEKLRPSHPSPHHMSMLCTLYTRNCDPVFKVLHIPTLEKLVANASANMQNMPFGNHVEALLFAMYYSATTSLTEEQCHQCFQDSREYLLAKYRAATEAALTNADLINTTELGTLQALVIFLSSVRTNDDSQYVWTMTSVAVRLGHGMGLHRENSRPGLSPFQVQMRRLLWWQMIHLDLRCCEDRGSDPFILSNSFNTKIPLNINDSDISPETTIAPQERQEFTDVSKSWSGHLVYYVAIPLGFVAPVKEGDEDLPPTLSFADKEVMIMQLQRKLENRVLRICDPAEPIQWVTAVVTRLILARLRLALYHPPMHDSRSVCHQVVSRESVLKAAVENLEFSHLLDKEPSCAQWRWYFKTHVQWHALAATLVELCVMDSGPLVDRAWTIVDAIFDDWAARIADSKTGMLWRPIKKLRAKAQSKREETRARLARTASQPQIPLPEFNSFNLTQDPNLTNSNILYHPNSVIGLSRSMSLDQSISSDVLSSLNVNDNVDAINWAEWDAFMQDFDMPDSGVMDPSLMQPQQEDGQQIGAWWW